MEEVGTSILSDWHCHLGEGCTYDAATDTAWWFDIIERQLFQADLASGAVNSHALPLMASVLAFIDDKRQLLATEDGLYVRDIADGRLTLHMPLEADNATTRSNDGRVHPCGALWIGTMGRTAEKGAGAIYRFYRGELRQLYARITIPNAICFSPDGATAYFTDTSKGVLYRVAVDPANALPTGNPETLYDASGGVGGLDGAVVDADGLIWNARWGGSCIDAYTPAGDRVRTIRIPAKQPSCPVFVGRNFASLLVTTAWEGMDEHARAADPHHGQTFVLDVGARGRPEPRIRLGSS
ncbi:MULTISPECIES: SMP-30/gluconolactonase/LRE family protein [unclassified Bradyrhizobium]|uniref:SMP-30/gluconolactonase/LRE family protein n=1 Tax=unclassified Bradyrhizobium TaxID=2631580 RepID=UPI001BA914A7|nr:MULTISPECIES: SMP-30/gluconolactonase/LRE family protein [unclassified Bradyrhizobium]MBR1225676.1 SMP-30/gluconolactonase/LRE family protein [Bradyrhizobium sp. AUGA SZCCT0176]MBR1298187.1 SMP-30/gluconolactonase/LRE family protein [Bradyrhizobium sp. AUGA SZCCT0042]